MEDKDWQQIAEEGLQQLIEGAVTFSEKLDKDGCIHQLKRKQAPNIDAIKFALKNRSGGKWADKTEVSHMQVNLNLSASYNEIKELMNKEKQILSLEDKDIIDCEQIKTDDKSI